MASADHSGTEAENPFCLDFRLSLQGTWSKAQLASGSLRAGLHILHSVWGLRFPDQMLVVHSACGHFCRESARKEGHPGMPTASVPPSASPARALGNLAHLAGRLTGEWMVWLEQVSADLGSHHCSPDPSPLFCCRRQRETIKTWRTRCVLSRPTLRRVNTDSAT